MQHRREHRPYGDLNAPIAIRRKPTLERTAIRFAGLGALAFIATAVLLLDPQSQHPRLASTKVAEASAIACNPQKLELAAYPSVIAVASDDRLAEQTSLERISSDADSSWETPTAEAQVASADQPIQQTPPERISSDASSSEETRAAEAQVASGDQPSQQPSAEEVSSGAGSSEETRAAEAQVAAPMVLAHNDIAAPVAPKAIKKSLASNSQLRTGKLAHAQKSKSPAPRRRRALTNYPSLRIGANIPMFDPVRYSSN